MGVEAGDGDARRGAEDKDATRLTRLLCGMIEDVSESTGGGSGGGGGGGSSSGTTGGDGPKGFSVGISAFEAATATANVYDVVARRAAGSATGAYSATVAPHDVSFVVLAPQPGGEPLHEGRR